MELEAFIDEVIAEKNLDDEDPEVLSQLKTDLLESIESRINAMIVSALSPEDLELFEKELDSGTEESQQSFVREKIPDIDQKVATELVSFRVAYLA